MVNAKQVVLLCFLLTLTLSKVGAHPNFGFPPRVVTVEFQVSPTLSFQREGLLRLTRQMPLEAQVAFYPLTTGTAEEIEYLRLVERDKLLSAGERKAARSLRGLFQNPDIVFLGAPFRFEAGTLPALHPMLFGKERQSDLPHRIRVTVNLVSYRVSVFLGSVRVQECARAVGIGWP